MKLKITIGCLIWMAAVTMTGCGMHHMVDGQVLDAVTRQPVQGAVVAVKWVRYKPTPPGLPTNKERYGTSESVTDLQGQFTIPKYSFGSHFMGVYKQGYVCWSSETIYNPDGKTYEQKYVYRKSHQVKDGMIIELVPISEGDFPVLEHANFVSNVRRPLGGRKFSDATKKEDDYFYEWYRKKIGKKK
jgi:hypothetical protein